MALPSTPSRQNLSRVGWGDTGRSDQERLRRRESQQQAEDLLVSTLAQQLREGSPGKSRNVSFNGVSVMVDTLMSVFKSISKKDSTDTALGRAVAENDIPSVHAMVAEGTASLHAALLAAVEHDLEDLLASLLPHLADLESRMEDTGCGLLHHAAIAGAISCVGLLLKAGARAHTWDARDHATPLHAAVEAGQNAKEVVELLLNNGADINAGLEKTGGSVLHAAVRARNVVVVKFLLDNKVETVPKTFSETALHVAAENNYVEIAKLLLERNPGCKDSLKGDTARNTALHLAADSGHPEMCALLLDAGSNMSQTNGERLTVLHLAARTLHVAALRLLLEHAGKVDKNLVNETDAEGRTPLFMCIVSNGNDARACMEAILDIEETKVDAQNCQGNTPLHLAAIDSKAGRVNLLIQRGADLSLKNNAGLSALYFINKKVPQCMKTFGTRLDQGLKLEGGGCEATTVIKMDFNKLSPNINSKKGQDISIFKEMIKSNHSDLLKHPLSEAFIQLKWNQIKWLYWLFHIICHVTYSVTYTVYALLVYATLCIPPPPTTQSEKVFFSYHKCSMNEPNSGTQVLFAQVSWIALIIFTLLYVMFEAVNANVSFKRYFKNRYSYLDVFLIISFPLISFHENPFQASVSIGGWQYYVAALGCVTTWLQMMFYIGKLPKFGKYVQMFKAVGKSVVHFMVAWVSLIFAFATSFMILFPHSESFENLFYTIIKLVVMMLGEIDYEDMFYPQKLKLNGTEITPSTKPQVFYFTSHVFVFMFMFLVSIIMMNLLVGLAVSDIASLRNQSKTSTLAQQVDLINYMEGWLSNPIFKSSPRQFQDYFRGLLQGINGQVVDREEGRQGKNYHMVRKIRPLDNKEGGFMSYLIHGNKECTLSMTLKRELLDYCYSMESKKLELSRDQEMKEMKDKIDCLFNYLVKKNCGKPVLKQSKSRQSILSDQHAIEDDYEVDCQRDTDYESDKEVEDSGLEAIPEDYDPVFRRNSCLV